MPEFVSPLDDLGGWRLSIEADAAIPEALRYGELRCRGLRAERTSAADILLPAAGTLRQASGDDGAVVVELQANPFGMRDALAGIRFGAPTFYFILPAGTSLAFDDGDLDDEGAALAAASEVTIIQIGQDRIHRDPAAWSRVIAEAIPDPETGPGSWREFADAVASLPEGGAPSVLLLDHCGRPVRGGEFTAVTGPPGATTSATVVMEEGDRGDLRSALRRVGLSDDLFAGGGSFRLERAGGDAQLARAEDGAFAGGSIEVTPNARHVLATDLHGWMREQFAIRDNETQPSLHRLTRGNRMTPYVNGKQFFVDFFGMLERVNGDQQGLHLTGGFSLEPKARLVTRRKGEDGPRTVEDIVKLMAAKDEVTAAARFLSAQFIQIEPGQTLTLKETIAVWVLVGAIAAANRGNVGLKAIESDGSGLFILVLLAAIHHKEVFEFVDEGGRPLEFMEEAVDVLDDPELKSLNKFSANPATAEDNPLKPSGFPFGTLFNAIRRFNLYHQKIAVIRNEDGLFGFCGGIDMNPNRVDDIHHQTEGPYHDVHAMVKGRAARDIAITFQERWDRDGVTEDGDPLNPAFTVPTDDESQREGDDLVQVARTYPATQTRELIFAPDGDRTILDTTLAAIEQAREYIHLEDQYFTPPKEHLDALVAKVASGDLSRLVIAIPTTNDQPFGEKRRSETLTALADAEAAAGAAPGEIVRIGVLRRHYTLPRNDLRASTGRCVLEEEIPLQPSAPGFEETILLGPKIRLPVPPFWIAVDGELMWVYDEAPSVSHPDPPKGTRRFLVDRGLRTRLFGTDTGARPRAHEKGAAATVVDLKGIFVHAKLMLVDDVFASIGSANINRRGFYSDGEGQLFWMPEALTTGGAEALNPVARLRQELWAEILNLPYPMAEPLLRDPVAASELFLRPPVHGNRFVPLDAVPVSLQLGAFRGGDRIIANVLKFLVELEAVIDNQALFDGVVDPSNPLEPNP